MPEFLECGATVVALSPQLQPFNDEATALSGATFPILRDADNAIATAFGLTLPTPDEVIAAERALGLDLPVYNGGDTWDLPMPARYVIDRNATILFASVHADHRMRSEPAECLKYLQNVMQSYEK